MHSIFSHRLAGVFNKPRLMPIACGRSLIPTGYFFSALLLFLFLPACGGTSGGGGSIAPFDVSPVTDLTVIPASGSLHLSWTNPNINDITGFDITWQRTRNASGGAVTEDSESDMKDNETAPGINATYLISGVMDNNIYRISVTVLAANGDSAMARLPGRVPGPNEDNDQLADHLDNCQTVPNPRQEDVNKDGQGDACETDAAQRPATEGVMDPIVIPGKASLSLAWTNPAGFITAFNISWVNTDDPDDAGTGSIDAFQEAADTNSETSSSFDIESLTDNANYGITITLMADADNSYATTEVLEATTGVNGDGDTLPDALDNCPTIANSDQSNQDELVEGEDALGDACDVDDDGDGLIEIRTAAELDNIRHNLAGTGYTQAAGEETNSVGCPADSGCNGYELSANISLTGMHWIPVGGDADDERFTADLDGKGNVISNVTITNAEDVLDGRTHIGFFARMHEATIQNLGLVIENFDVNIPTAFNFGGLSGSTDNTDIINSYVIFSDALSIETSAERLSFGGLSGGHFSTTVDRSYVVLPNNISISINLVESFHPIGIGGMFGRFDSLLLPSINNSYVIYRGDLMITPIPPGGENALIFSIMGFAPSEMPMENSYALFPGNLSVTGPQITDASSGILPPAARSSYFHARTDTDNPNYRTLSQLRCPTGPDATCDGPDGSLEGTNTTYANWDASIWKFGNENTLPTLRGIPSCPAGYPHSECRFGRSPE